MSPTHGRTHHCRTRCAHSFLTSHVEQGVGSASRPTYVARLEASARATLHYLHIDKKQRISELMNRERSDNLPTRAYIACDIQAGRVLSLICPGTSEGRLSTKSRHGMRHGRHHEAIEAAATPTSSTVRTGYDLHTVGFYSGVL